MTREHRMNRYGTVLENTFGKHRLPMGSMGDKGEADQGIAGVAQLVEQPPCKRAPSAVSRQKSLENRSPRINGLQANWKPVCVKGA